MTDIKRISLQTGAPIDPWKEFQDENTVDFLAHLRSDNQALRQLRDALAHDAETTISSVDLREIAQ
ncbi:hypothetical protein [Aureimonas sp. ME7]|uniref:hypothetical protein n=1 Tax=Aureimonas sp. ME7 TaxID=2744252 RepID=UPI0015FBC495|nr:hypothetical protein [Aureimonas sp. ME7]